ncbi:MAG: hypothetical protein ACXWTY_12755 [Methylobacter sp.]
MNNKIILVAILALTACGKSDDEKQTEKDAAISKKMAGSIASIPRIHITPPSKNERGQ